MQLEIENRGNRVAGLNQRNYKYVLSTNHSEEVLLIGK